MKNILFFILFIGTVPILYSQRSNQEENDELRKLPFKDRLTYYLGGGLNFGNNFSSISLQPQVGYKVTTKLTVGVGINFQYTKYFGSVYQIYGGNVFARYFITKNFFGQAQYEMLNYQYQTFQSWNDYLLLGGGYYSGKGLFISGYYLLKYPANNNIYGGPYVLRIGFMF